MKPGEQLTWALLAVTALALPKWVFGASLFARKQVILEAPFWSLPVILLAGFCSLRLIDKSQTLSALFGMVAAAYSTTPICLAGYDCTRYQVAALIPVVFWVIAATYPNSDSVWARRTAIAVSAFGIAAVATEFAGFSPFFWPAVLEPGYRVWEWAALASVAGLLTIRLRSGGFRLPLAKSRVFVMAFGPALAFVTLDLLFGIAGTVGAEPPPIKTLLVVATNVALGWGIFTLTRAEIARHKESHDEAEQGKPHRL